MLSIANGGTNSSTLLINGYLMVSNGGKIVEGISATAPSFTSITTTGNITDGALGTGVVHANASGVLSSGAVGLATADVTGTLPIANGGTNSSTALNNGFIMISNNGKIVEGTSATNPSFATVTSNSISADSIKSTGNITDGALGTGVVHANASGVLSSSAVGLATADVTGTLPIANGGTNSSTALNNRFYHDFE